MGYHGVTGEPSGLGAPVKIDNRHITQNGEEEVHGTGVLEEASPTPEPFQIDTTGLSTSNLPKPPLRRVDPNTPLEPNASTIAKKPKPSLPPRLPPRQASVDSNGSPSPPPSYSAATGDGQSKDGYLNQGALNRLGAAGVSVPGFGIGRASGGNQTTQDPQSPAKNTNTPIRTPALSEFNARFSRMSSSSPPASPSQGTTFAQKQAALKTASTFRNDPSSVSLSDARAAASTANNFRERHGDQVTAGVQGASNLNKKYGISNRLAGFAPTGGTTSDEAVRSPPTSPTRLEQPAMEARKKPPPPPPRRPTGDSGRVLAPPPVPFSSKPK